MSTAQVEELLRQAASGPVRLHSPATPVAGNPARKQRRRTWRALLSKESVTTIVGAYLLVLLGSLIVVEAFAEVPVTDVVTSSFLLVLGYFFGHGTAPAAPTRGRRGRSR